LVNSPDNHSKETMSMQAFARRSLVRSALSLLTLMLACLASGPAPAQTPAKVKVGVLFLGGATHIYAAQKLGYFQRENLDVELRSLGGGAQVVPLLVSGDVNVGMVNQVSWMLALSQGYDIVAVAATSAEKKAPPYANNIFVATDSPVQSAKDLEGKRIATNTLNNILTLYGNEWARKHGADPKKLQWTEVPFPQMPDTLINKRVDAAFIVEPFGSIAKSSGKARVLASPMAEVYPKGLFFSVLGSNRAWLNANEDAMRRFVKAMTEVTELLGRDEKPRLELIAEFTKMKPELVQQLVNDDLIVKINPEALNLTVDLMTKDGLLRSSLDIRKYLWSHAPLEN
jgi:NitT/TauT family transport system substrate-binding protein